mgnify:CR=1 FL=1
MDLKPDNILIMNKTEIKVTDFGIIKTFDWSNYMSQSGGLISFWAASPEVINEEEYGRA